MKYLSLFSGIGAFEKAMQNIGMQYELIGYSEIDKYASKSYSEIFGVPESMNLGDITKIDATALPAVDLITYGFPCQDISRAGLKKGFTDENGIKTRSGLFYDAMRIIEHCKPKIAIAENVKALTSGKFKNEFNTVLTSLDNAGYRNYCEVLDSKNYGIPQHRERVFIVSIRKDIDQGFEFPQKQELKLRLKDILETSVDESYYLSKKIQNRLIITDSTFTKNVIGSTKGSENTRHGERDVVYNPEGIVGALAATDYKQPKQIAIASNLQEIEGATFKGYSDAVLEQVGQIYPDGGNPQAGRVYNRNGISPTLDTCQGGNRMPKIIDHDRVRKLTPKEYWRLMGFTDDDFKKCTCSNTQLYKQAGNSIVVNVAEAIMKQIREEYAS